jgi:predicted enzyme related to lactoylglutathione lyase
MEIKFSEIGQIAITVSNVGSALAFYRRFCSTRHRNSRSWRQGRRIMLTIPQGAGTVGANSVLYFKVSDIKSTHKELVKRCAQSEREPQLAAKLPDHELWLGFLRDPDGNLVGLMEEKR